jgi:hypothetical protein
VSDVEGVVQIPAEEPPAQTAGAASPAPEEAAEPVAAVVLACPICGHAESAHVSSGRCLVMLGDFGTEGACPCPEAAA